MPYCNSFGSIWEYNRAFKAEEIDFYLVIGIECPLCKQKGRYRQIEPYCRIAIDLLPYREGKVMIPRFQCTTLKQTFSLLPIQLVPYHQYTAAALVFALLLAKEHGDDEGLSIFGVAEKVLNQESRATGFLLSRWLQVVSTGLRRANHVLVARYDFTLIATGFNAKERLDEAWATFAAASARGPPGRVSDVHQVLEYFSRVTGHFLFGTPSQERMYRRTR